jgi:G3E family GTPase
MAELKPWQDDRFGRRLKKPGAGKIPILIVTGFLGAGKTSLIKKFLGSAQGERTALIVNEFGAVDIDSILLREGSEKTISLGNGCICCSAGTDLQRTLKELFRERVAGTVPSFQRVVIETSGLADPSPLLQTVASDRSLWDRFFFAGLIAVVDAVNAIETHSFAPEWQKQVALADRILVTKRDLATPEQMERLSALLAEVSSGRVIWNGDEQLAVLAAPVLEDSKADIARRALLEKQASAHSSIHVDPYHSFVVTLDTPIPWLSFERAVDMLCTLRGRDLLRVKGLVHIEGRAGPVVVHIVQHIMHGVEELEHWPDEDRRSRLVFITRAIDPVSVHRLFEATLGIGTGRAPE